MQKTVPATKATTATTQEVEIKIKTTPALLKKIEAWLKKNATFQGEELHRELYLDNPNATFFFTRPDGEKDALKYLRVRWLDLQQGFKGSVCFKDWYEDENGRTTHCDEFETKVADPDMMLALFERLGYTHKTVTAKKRKKFRFKEYEIVVDEVQDLGTFVEIEMKKQVSDFKAALHELEMFLVKKIGITEYWIQTRGYASSFRNPDFEFGEHRKH